MERQKKQRKRARRIDPFSSAPAPETHSPDVTQIAHRAQTQRDPAAFTPHEIASLHSVYGNRGVQRMFGRGENTPAVQTQRTSAPTIQRLEGIAKETTSFSKSVKKVKKDIDGNTALGNLEKELNSRLGKHKVPHIPIKAVAMPDDQIQGNFESSAWEIRVNQIKIQGNLSAEQYKELAVTIFHEGRHSEQFFTMARYAASEIERITQSDNNLAYQTRMVMNGKLPMETVTEAVAKRQMTNHKYDFGKRMYDSIFIPIDQAVQAVNQPVRGKTERPDYNDTYAELHAAKRRFAEVDGYVKDYNQRNMLTETQRRNRGHSNNLIDAWRNRSNNYLDLYHAHLLHEIFVVNQDYRQAMTNYKNLPIEQDAFGVEEVVKDKLKLPKEQGELVSITKPLPAVDVRLIPPDFEPGQFNLQQDVDFFIDDTEPNSPKLVTQHLLVPGDVINNKWALVTRIGRDSGTPGEFRRYAVFDQTAPLPGTGGTGGKTRQGNKGNKRVFHT